MVPGNLESESGVGRSYMDLTHVIGVTGMHSDIMDAVNNSRNALTDGKNEIKGPIAIQNPDQRGSLLIAIFCPSDCTMTGIRESYLRVCA